MPETNAAAVTADDLQEKLASHDEAVRLYLRPLGLLAGRPAVELAAAGRACLVAGGPVAALSCEVLARAARQVERTVLPVADLRGLIERVPTTAARRIADLLRRIEAPREGAKVPCLMGVVNVTPDSFSDGGVHLDPAAALAQCRALASAGADILDIGGESTRPGAAPVPPAQEWARVQPVLDGLRALRGELAGVRLSIDTRHAEVMRGAVQAGIDIINDVSSLTGDPDSIAVATASGAHVVLMHMQGTPETMNVAPAYDDVVLDVFDFLEARVQACIAAGIDRRRLIVDPGIGFGKRGRENQAILRALTLFHGLGCPILLGLSRKGLGIGRAALAPQQREPTSHAAAMHALCMGVQILRVHDVAGARQVVDLWRRLAEPR